MSNAQARLIAPGLACVAAAIYVHATPQSSTARPPGVAGGCRGRVGRLRPGSSAAAGGTAVRPWGRQVQTARRLGLSLLTLSAGAVRASDGPPAVVFRGVTVVDVEAGRRVPGRAVVVTGPAIAAVVDDRGLSPPEGGDRR